MYMYIFEKLGQVLLSTTSDFVAFDKCDET